MKKFYTILFLLFAQFSFAQSDTTLPKGIIKFSPTSFFNIITPAIQFAYEQPWKDNKTIQLEVGYLDNFMTVDEWVGGVYDFSGYRLKGEIRNYYHDGFARGSYIGGMLVLKQTFYEEREDWFFVHKRSFSQKLPYRRMSSNVGFYFTIGKQFISSNNSAFEIGFAMGVRFLHHYALGLPDFVNNPFTVYGGSNNDLMIFSSLYPTLKFGYVIEKRKK